MLESADVGSLLTVKSSIFGHELNMSVDTGFGVTLIREDVWKQIRVNSLGTLQPVLRLDIFGKGIHVVVKVEISEEGIMLLMLHVHAAMKTYDNIIQCSIVHCTRG